MVSTGTFHRTLDSKLRVLLPKKLRDRIGIGLRADEEPGASTGSDESDEKRDNDTESVESIDLYLTPGTDGCLELHTLNSLNELAIQARQNNPGTQNIRAFSRLFYARAQVCEMDGQGRIRIPKDLADWASLEKDIVFVGVGFHWEVWNLDRWNHFLDQNNEQFDRIVESTFDPAIPVLKEEANLIDTPKPNAK